jgi:hypothetical protein
MGYFGLPEEGNTLLTLRKSWGARAIAVAVARVSLCSSKYSKFVLSTSFFSYL